MTAAFRQAILETYGVAPEEIEEGRIKRFSRTGRKSDLSAWCLLFVGGQLGVFGDWRDGPDHHTWRDAPSERMPLADKVHMAWQLSAARAEAQGRLCDKRQNASKWIAKLWKECQTVRGDDAVAAYLQRRVGLAASRVPKCIRAHDALVYFHEGQPFGAWPAMVAALQAPNGNVVALHRTWLRPDGQKADTPGPVKKLTCAAGPVSGGCIRLNWPHEGRTLETIGVAEGIETALAAQAASGVSTVAAYSANNLAVWQWPPGVRRIVVFADHDSAGLQAAQGLKRRAIAARVRCDVLIPAAQGVDWCDVWASRPAAPMDGEQAA